MHYIFTIFLVAWNLLFAFDKAAFFRKIQEAPPAWMVEQIEGDLASFDAELSRTALDKLFVDQGNDLVLIRVRIIGRHISVEYSEAAKQHASHHQVIPKMLAGLERLHHLVLLPEVDLLFTGLDTLPSYATPNWPLFAESKNRGNPGLLLPDRWALQGYIPEKTEVLAGNLLSPWDTKIPRLFFRGSDTGMYPGQKWSNWGNLPRVLAVRLSLQHPDLVDAKFFYSLHNYAMVDRARAEGLLTEEYVPLKDHPRYKYLIDLDGNCASCPRTAAIFHANSVVFKEVSASCQWWYNTLKPYEHFIPFSSDLSDILAQLEWAKNHDDLCKTISENGQRLVHDVLAEESIYHYMYELITAYAKKQKQYYYGHGPHAQPMLPEEAKKELQRQYEIHWLRSSDINEHLPTLRRIARECRSVAELGVRSIVSSWALLQGLVDNPGGARSYVGVDLEYPSDTFFGLLKEITEANDIAFDFCQCNDMDIELKEVDLLFIDTLHTYAHLTYELEKFAPQAKKYIIMHDTSDIFEYHNCVSYTGDYTEYPSFIDRTKSGLWPAVQDFLAEHPEWLLHERYVNSYGLTVLKRV